MHQPKSCSFLRVVLNLVTIESNDSDEFNRFYESAFSLKVKYYEFIKLQVLKNLVVAYSILEKCLHYVIL